MAEYSVIRLFSLSCPLSLEYILINVTGRLSHLFCHSALLYIIMLDAMWRRPKTLFWPMRGHRFEKEDTSHWIEKMFHKLHTETEVYIPELIGAAIVVGLVRGKL